MMNMIIVLIRTTTRTDVDRARYEALNARMEELVLQVPGFVSAKSFKADDGDEISMVCFESAEALAAWRNHPEHAEAQRAGKEWVYASYQVQVCEVVRAYDFVHDR